MTACSGTWAASSTSATRRRFGRSPPPRSGRRERRSQARAEKARRQPSHGGSLPRPVPTLPETRAQAAQRHRDERAGRGRGWRSRPPHGGRGQRARGGLPRLRGVPPPHHLPPPADLGVPPGARRGPRLRRSPSGTGGCSRPRRRPGPWRPITRGEDRLTGAWHAHPPGGPPLEQLAEHPTRSTSTCSATARCSSFSTRPRPRTVSSGWRTGSRAPPPRRGPASPVAGRGAGHAPGVPP